MIVFKSIQEIKKHLKEKRNQHNSIGFIPTMGALHKGHTSLINKAKQECDVVVSSIFVNPTQFNNLDDLKNYPRTLDKDILLIEESGCDIVFTPEITEMYSTKELDLKQTNKEDDTWKDGKEIHFGLLEKVMEGLHRPGHFNGVAQVVSKLFKIVEPDKAYFGQKDFQQLAIISSLVKQLQLPIQIIGCEIVREANGLAMSSRNERLTSDERQKASIISQTLFKVKQLKSNKTVGELKQLVQSEMKEKSFLQLEYFEIADKEDLQPLLNTDYPKHAVACIAVYVGLVRLIDNVILE